MGKLGTSLLIAVTVAFSGAVGWAATPMRDEVVTAREWANSRFAMGDNIANEPRLEILENHDPVQKDSRFGKPLLIDGQAYSRGLYCHARSEILVHLLDDGAKFESLIGVDGADAKKDGPSSVVFVVRANGKDLYRSDVLRAGQSAVSISVDLGGVREFSLIVEDGGDGIAFDQADWAEPKVTSANGTVSSLCDLPMAQSPIGMEKGVPPFSFVYNGASSREFLKHWKEDRKEEKIDAQRTRTTISYTSPGSGLEVCCVLVRYSDYPMVEWTVYLKNAGSEDTGILENVLALDAGMTRGDRDEYLLHHFIGSPCKVNDYEPITTPLAPSSETKIGCEGGRGTSSNLCYFNIESLPNQGVIFGLGWPGQWVSNFTRDAAKGLRITAGQEDVHLKLHPGEEIRTPLVVAQFWEGDWMRAQNVWRSWMIDHNIPKPGGEAVKPFVTADSSAQFAEMTGATEASQKYFIDRYQEERLGIEYWWMDAGWYPCDNSWPKTGTWEVDATRFPNGLKAISDHAHEKGLKIILWFEPERVHSQTWLTEQHPDWILGGANGGLLNLGNDEARAWLIDHVDKLMNEQGIDLYRQDFNCEPLAAWRANDAKESPEGERKGITENKHIVGLFTYWDELVRRRNGNLLIDTCASGGRRNDLETLRRAVPLWRSDYPFDPTGTQCHTYGISFWIPISGTGVKVIDNYDFRSNAAPEFTCHWDMREKSLDYDLLRRQLEEWRGYSPNFMGDYYPLTEYSTKLDVWMAWQFDRPEEGKGMVQAFRRPNCPYTSAAFPLRGLDPNAQYSVMDIDAKTSVVVDGKTLMSDGVNISAPKRPNATVLLYEKQ